MWHIYFELIKQHHNWNKWIVCVQILVGLNWISFELLERQLVHEDWGFAMRLLPDVYICPRFCPRFALRFAWGLPKVCLRFCLRFAQGFAQGLPKVLPGVCLPKVCPRFVCPRFVLRFAQSLPKVCLRFCLEGLSKVLTWGLPKVCPNSITKFAPRFAQRFS